MPRVPALEAMHATLDEHVQGADAPEGSLQQLIDVAPWLAPRVHRLRTSSRHTSRPTATGRPR